MEKVIRAFYRLLHRLTSVPGLGRIIARTWRPVQVVEVLTANTSAEGVFFTPEEAITSRVQEFGRDFVTPTPEEFPEVGWRVVNDATYMTTRHFSFLVSESEMMIGRRRNPGPWRVVRRGNNVLWQDGTKALVHLTRGNTITADGAIALGGRAHTNWYHWLTDALPQLHQAGKLPEPYRHWPVLVPAPIFRYPTMVEALELFLDGRTIITVPEWSRVQGTIVWIDSLENTNVPESLTTPKPQSQIHLLHRSGMEVYRDVFLSAYGDTSSPYGPRVFLTRLGNRRTYNQDEIADVAGEFGFTAVAPETLSLAEQVSLFHHATHLIGPSGAGFAGVLFVQPGAKVLCWQDSRLTAMTILPDLATLNHAEYWHVFYEPHSGGIFTGDYDLDPDQMRQALAEFVREDS